MATVNIYNMADTWNDGATTFTAIKMDVTDTASTSGSLLMDLQVGGTTKFSIDKNGLVRSPHNTGGGFLANLSGGVGFQARWGTAFIIGSLGSSAGTLEFKMDSGAYIAWNNSTLGVSSLDTYLTRKGAANLRLGLADAAAPVAQTLSVQSVTGVADTAGADFTIEGSQGTGTGAGGSILFKVAPAGGAGSGQNTPQQALRVGQVGSFEIGTYAYTRNATNYVLVGGDGNNYPGVLTSTGYFGVRTSQYTNEININTAGLHTGTSDGVISFNGGYNTTGAGDVVLARDAANTLALRNGANAQTFNIYNTWSSATVYERFSIIAQSGGAVQIGTNKGSAGGTARALDLQTDGQTRFTIPASTNQIIFNGEGRISRQDSFGGIIFQSTNGIDIGVTGAKVSIMGVLELNDPDTVSSLPTPSVGMIARVTDGDSGLTFGNTVVNSGAGATPYLVWYNGTNWTVIGA